MKVFGLTGGLASGKSAVARMFRQRGVPVVDADVLAREVVEKGSEGLAEIVFADPEKRRALNRIVHPRVGRSRRSASRSSPPRASRSPVTRCRCSSRTASPTRSDRSWS